MIQSVLVLGSGSAGLIAALGFKRKLPQLAVRVVRSPEIGIIGVGEGTTPSFPKHIFEFLGISRKRFYALAEPTWKLGVRFLWGPRGRFDYAFLPQLDLQWKDLPMPHGFYCDEEFRCNNIAQALMAHDKAFVRQANGCPEIEAWQAFHIENVKLVHLLETIARESGVEIIDGRVNHTEMRPEGGVASVGLEDGRRFGADLFIDASGFRSELIGRALGEPFESFDRSLFCDRAVVGGWERTDEPILPYTTAETMDAGWAWRIDHEHHVNRGYVYSSQAISDEAAAEEFLRCNPKAPRSPRIVKFRSGHHRRQWVDNVVAIGNAAGFVEPLEATALMIVCGHTETLIHLLSQSRLRPTPTIRALFNDITSDNWKDIRDFLALHYKFNTARDTPFWRHCQNDTDVSRLQGLLDFYAENGPSNFCRHRMPSLQSDFGSEGFLVMLVGNRVPYAARHRAGADELRIWNAHRAEFSQLASRGMSVKEALSYVHHPGWTWNADAGAS